MECLFKNEDVTLQQYNVLRILRGQYPKPATVNLIIDRMLDKMSNASRLVDKLQANGYVSRTKNAIDKRAVDVLITDKGLRFIEKMNVQLLDFETNTFDLSQTEIKTLNLLLDKMRGN